MRAVCMHKYKWQFYRGGFDHNHGWIHLHIGSWDKKEMPGSCNPPVPPTLCEMCDVHMCVMMCRSERMKTKLFYRRGLMMF